jgi:hypothetical protein
VGELRKVEGQRGRLHAEPLSDDPGRQPLRAAGDQKTEQLEAGFLGESREGGDRTLLVHAKQTIQYLNYHQNM